MLAAGNQKSKTIFKKIADFDSHDLFVLRPLKPSGKPSTWYPPGGILKLEKSLLGTENQQINKCSYLALELIIYQNIKKKNKKQQWEDLLDRLQMLDKHDMLENYLHQVLSIVSYIDFSTITTTTTDY